MNPLYEHAIRGLELEIARAKYELATYADGGDAQNALDSLVCYAQQLADAIGSEAARLEKDVSVHD